MRHFHDAKLNLWYDDGIPPAEEWQNEIAQKIMGSDMFAVFLSPSACASSHVNREIQFALSENKPILPVFLEEISLTPSLKLCLQQFQSCFYYKIGWQKKAIEVMRKVLTKADSLGQNRHFTKGKSSGEEVLDEGEALWKIMEQVFPPKSTGIAVKKPTLLIEAKEDDSEKEDKRGLPAGQTAPSAHFGKAQASESPTDPSSLCRRCYGR